MSTRKLNRAIQTLLLQIRQLARATTKGLVRWLLRNLLILGRQPKLARAGFVLPTTVLLLLVVLLTVGSIGYRTYTRTTQTIGERQQKVIYNAATPAIDRAKAKLEYLFDAQRDPRFPSGVPAEDQLEGMMLNYAGGTTVGTLFVPEHRPGGVDPYQFPDETRINIGGRNNAVDNAWRYRADTDGDGVVDATVVYSIVFKSDPQDLANTSDARVQTRANNLFVRHGPLSNNNQENPACAAAQAGAAQPQQGWIPDGTNSAVLRKNFQVDVLVVPDTRNRPVTALEFHQDRRVDRGNKWGAWFRNDLEVFAGPGFNWNGAMHSEGNIIVGNGSFTSFMISDQRSCLYTQDASEVSVVQVPARGTVPAFRGGFIAGKINNNRSEAGDVSRFHLWNGAGQAPHRADDAPRNINVTLTSGSDSVNPPDNPQQPAKYAVDPVWLQTRGESVARNIDPIATAAAWTNTAGRLPSRLIVDIRRDPPYVDDTFRADDRYGPKPTYGRDSDPDLVWTGSIGGQIPSTNAKLIGNAPGPGQDNTSVGLDGYWERRARIEGARVIVGQRLELGDPAGWGGPWNRDGIIRSQEPLRPWESRCTTENNNNTGRCNEARQRRSLWDNLAAVQAAAVYHSAAGADPDQPIACLASTVHPGTAGTLERSATFENLAFGLEGAIAGYGNDDGIPVISDFFRGRGTNGFEFQAPARAQFLTTATPTMVALKNLALLAGDPNGGAPSFTPVQDRNVHPFPSFAMWGDFSSLRRVFNLLDNSGFTYDRLSPADKTTLHTAACMMGMLAYNIDYLESFDPTNAAVLALLGTSYPTAAADTAARTGSPNTYYAGLRGIMRALRDGITPLGTISDFNSIIEVTLQGNLSPANPEAMVRLMQRWRDIMPANNGPVNVGTTSVQVNRALMNQYITLAQLIISKEQVARDRRYGFLGSGSTANESATVFSTGSLAGTYSGVNGCQGLVNGNLPDPVRYLCSSRPRYPVLYDLFPAPEANGGAGRHPDAWAPRTSVGAEFARDSLDSAQPYLIGQNNGAFFERVDPAAIRLLPQTNQANWQLPVETLTAAPAFPTPNSNRDNLIKVCLTDLCLDSTRGPQPTDNGAYWRVGFKDAAPFNGREMLVTRVMNMHLDLMRNSPVGGSDRWLPNSGIIYAYREDAMSEAELVRPAANTWTSCSTDNALQTVVNCQMAAGANDAFRSTDPPLNASNGITPKPVDYFADPDRRPHGFRLMQGANLTRPGDNGRGLSLISDNPVYIQGNFNLHLDGAGNRLEEFNTPLDPGFGNFYTRGAGGLDGEFARPATDQWRPSEVLADGITILSDNFCDGSIQDTFLTYSQGGGADLDDASSPQVSRARYGCTSASNISSYLNQNRPNGSPAAQTRNSVSVRWMRTNIADVYGHRTGSGATGGTTAGNFVEGDSPIMISPNGNAFGAARDTFYTGGYRPFTEGKPRNAGIDGQRVNSIVISGLVPSRPGQSYGGLHNFPRFLENWGGQDLFISGSLIQLNFSQQATGPFDQDRWEVSTTGADPNNEIINYYNPPDRRWGYDVGLQYAPAGPVAQRFVSVRSIRSEFYNEPAVTDPYIVNLCTAYNANRDPGVPAITCN